MPIIAASEEELIAADKYAEIPRGLTLAVRVEFLPGSGHTGMMPAQATIYAAIEASPAALDHDTFRSIRPNRMNVFDSNNVDRDFSEKPEPLFRILL